MAYDETLAKRIRGIVATHAGVSERKMFGGICFLLNDHMACGIVADKLMLRVGVERYDALMSKPHVEPMDFTGRPMRGMLYVNAAGTKTEAALRKWVELALNVAATAPAKKPKAPKKPKTDAAAATEARVAKLRAKYERSLPGPFTGVPKQTLAFLRGLEQHNHKTWFDAHRSDYEEHYVRVGAALVEALGPRLQKLAPGIQFDARVNGSLFRIHRDVRFSKDKTPYKPHLDLWFWEGSRKGWNAPGFFLRVTPSELIVGCGIHRFEPEQLERYRNAVLDVSEGKALASRLRALTSKGYELGKPERKGVPRGFPADHARADLLRHDGLTVMLETSLPPELHKPAFVEYCAAHYKRLVPVHEWLLSNLS